MSQLQLRYFASLREQLGLGEETIEFSAELRTVSALIDHLIAQRGESWQRLAATNTLVAVNHEMVDRQYSIKEGDEVAFFPPVTGG